MTSFVPLQSTTPISPGSVPAVAPILVAEDEETDVMILRMALKRAGFTLPVVVVQDGQEAVDYLCGNPPFADRSQHPLPALLLLDLKMPRMTGFEVLAWLGTQGELKKMPAVILSSSSHEDDMQKARQLGAADYHVKPHCVSELVEILQGLRSRWLTTPPGQGSGELRA